MKTARQTLWGSLLSVLLSTSFASAAEAPIVFGLPHSPLGGANISTDYGYLYVSPGGTDLDGDEEFGVSVSLGEADCGVWGELSTSSSFLSPGNFMVGYVYGQLNGVPEMELCSLRAEALGSYGPYAIDADFSPLGSGTVTYQVFNGARLVAVATNQTDPALAYSYNDSSPRANPFWKLPDGQVVALVEFTYPQPILLPNMEEGEEIAGDRLIIIPENNFALVDFASQVDLWAGGGEDGISISQEHLGMFSREHKALGEPLLQAAGGALTIARQYSDELEHEIGVSISLAHSRQFSLQLQPLELLREDATVLLSAISAQPSGEFLGCIGIQNLAGNLEAFGDFSSFVDQLQLAVYYDGSLVGTRVLPASRARVPLAGTPRIIGLAAAADAGSVRAGFSIRLDQVTAFSLPDASTLAGDEIRFQFVNSPSVEHLGSCSLTFSNLAAVTISGETGPQILSLVDYFPEVVAPGVVKAFTGFINGGEAEFTRTVERTNRNSHPLRVISDRYSATDVLSATYSFQQDGLYLHGYATADEDLFSTLGLRLLPEQITLGQSYYSMGSFEWTDTNSGLVYPLGISSLTRVADLEQVNLLAGNFAALRVETVFSFTGTGYGPTNWRSTNWLAEGVGVIKFNETYNFQDGSVRTRSGELTDYVIVHTPMRALTANVGANIHVNAEVSSPGPAWIQWLKNGLPLGSAAYDNIPLFLEHLQETHAGIYSVQVALGDKPDALVCDVGALRVLPFSDTPPFWAKAIGGNSSVVATAVKADTAGNVYLAGYFRGTLNAGYTNLVSRGSEDIFIMKLLPSGSFAWIRTAGGNFNDYPASLATDASGNVYMAGTFVGNAFFGSIQLTSAVPRVDPMFVTKIDPNGNFLWAVANQGVCNAYSSSMTIDPAGNLYVLGGFYSGAVIFGSTTLTNCSSAADLFFAKLAPDGQFLWARQISDETPGYEGGVSTYGCDLACDNAGSVWMVGAFGEQISFDGITLHSGRSYWEGAGFLAKADSAGHFLAAKVLGHDAYGITADPFGNVYVIGSFIGVARIDGALLVSRTGWSDEFLAKFGPAMLLEWARLSPHRPHSHHQPLVADSEGKLYVAGSFWDEAGYEGTSFVQTYDSSTMLSKLDPAGRALWHKQISGVQGNWPQCLARDNAGNVYLGGEFLRQAVFGDTVLNSTNSANVYLVKITGATAPTISQQPLPQTVNPGEPASFSVGATGTEPLSYQWRKNQQDIPGAASSTYAIPSATAEDAGAYSVLVKNAGGMALSAEANLQVIVPDAGTFQFSEPNYIIDESNAWLSVTVIRTGDSSVAASVQLLTRDGTAVAGDDFWTTAIWLQFAAGEVSKTVLVPILDNWPWEPTEAFVLRLSNPGAGAHIGSQGTATVVITDNDVAGAPVIRAQPVSRLAMVGQSVGFGVVAEGTPPLSYQWFKDGLEIPDATNHSLIFPSVQLTDAGAYSVLVRNSAGSVTSSTATLTVLPLPDIHYVMFGLTNRALGNARINTNNGTLEITPRPGSDEFGVSITLGEADSGAFGYLSTGGSFQSDGTYTAGYVYGRLNGVPDQFLCSLRATTVDWFGVYAVTADFSPLHPSRVTYQVFNHDTLVASAQAYAVYISDYTEYSPFANPFWRLPDGTIAALIQLSAPRPVSFDRDDYVTGDRILIRAENTTAVADFASRIDVLAGGGEDLIVLDQVRLGMFNRSHLALGDAIFKALGGQLTVAQLHPGQETEIGTSIVLENTRQFKVQLQPQPLPGEGAFLMASAVGTYNGQNTAFLGYTALRNRAGTMEITGDLPCSPAGIEVLIYRSGSPVATVPLVSHSATVPLSGNPGVVDFEVAADNGLTPPWLAVQLDRLATFVLPDGSSLEGDQIRFRAANTVLMDGLSAFSLTGSNLAEFTILAEPGLQPIGLAEYIPELLTPRSLKKFSGAQDGSAVAFLRASSRTDFNPSGLAVITERAGETNVSSGFYSARDGGLLWHGTAWGLQSLSNAAGLFLLPDEIVPGQNYIGQASFDWQDQASGQQAVLDVTAVSRLSWDGISSPIGAASVLRLETELTFSGSASLAAPAAWRWTNWLAPGIGVFKFSESMLNAAGQTHDRSGELTDALVLKTKPQAPVANIGANIVLSIETLGVGAASIIEWQHNGASVSGSATDRVYLNQLQNTHAGLYSVVLAIPELTTTCEVATVRVVPFSDTPPFWAGQLGASIDIFAGPTAVDADGNIYLGGHFRGALQFGTNTINSFGLVDIFLAKFNGSGQLLWVRTAGGPFSDYLQGLGIDDGGNVYLTGTFLGTATFGALRLSGPPSSSPHALFVAKADSTGNFLWAVASAGASSLFQLTEYYCNSVAVEPSGNLYISGAFNHGVLTFGSLSITNDTWDHNLFLAKFNSQGQCLWLRQATGYFYPSTVLADGAGAVYLCGLFYTSATFGHITISSGPSSSGGYLTKVDSEGNFLWAKALGSDARNLALDQAGNICLSGEFYSLLNLDRVLLSSRSGGNDYFLAKFAPDGSLLWARLGPHHLDFYGRAMVTDSSDNLYLAAYVYGESSYDGTMFWHEYSGKTMLSKLDSSGRSLWHKQLSGSHANWPRSLARDRAGNVYLAGGFRSEILFGDLSLTGGVPSVYLVKITGATPPTLAQQPQPQTVNLGEPASFSVIASGTEPLSYQWRKNEQQIIGATGSSYGLASASAEDAGLYSVLVKNPGGILISANATLQVVAPEAGTIVLSAAEYNVVETASVAVVTLLRTGSSSITATVGLRTADDTAIAGLDYVPTAASLRFAPGETLKTLSIPVLDNEEWEPAETFTVRLCSPGTGVTLGAPAMSLVRIVDNDLLGAPVIRVQPSDQHAVEGGAVSFFVSAVGAAPLNYQWRKDGLLLSGATNHLLAIPAAQTNHAGVYSVVVGNSVSEISSAGATLDVLLPPLLVTPLQNQTISCGETATLSIVAQSRGGAGESLAYLWHKDGSEIPGATGSTLTIDPVNTSDQGTYIVQVTGQNGVTVSSSATLNVVGPLLRITTLPGQLQLWWRASEFHLEATDDPIDGSWQDVEGASSGISLPASEPQKFFRLRAND